MLLLERLIHPDVKLSQGQRDVAQWLLTHRDEVGGVTVKQIAADTYTSPATVVRLAKALGYGGFEDLRQDLVAESTYLNQHFAGVDANAPFSATDGPATVAAKVASLARETADDTLALLDDATLMRATDLIDQAGALHMAAVSFPVLYAQDFQMKLRRVGKRVELITTVGEPAFAENLVRPNDCALIISYSGTTPATLDAARMYQHCGIPLIALTSMGTNPLRTMADVTLTLTTRERLYSKVAGFTSELSIKLVLDTLYGCLFVRHMDEFARAKERVSQHAEPGRTSDSSILREQG
ncbi:MAG: MurR/RpiR family transcriptional regulator [bacterium]|nr:MurR/RpiR family transcriptional regulator [bacterium]